MVCGRWDMSDVGMGEFGVCMKKGGGNIGNRYEGVKLRRCEYGYGGERVGGMDCGWDRFGECYFEGICK